MAFGAVCPSLQTTWLINLHTQNNKTITYYASDNKSEDAKLIDYRYIVPALMYAYASSSANRLMPCQCTLINVVAYMILIAHSERISFPALAIPRLLGPVAIRFAFVSGSLKCDTS